MATNTEKIVVQVVVQGDKQLDNLQKKTGATTRSFGKMAAGILGAVAAFRTVTQAVSAGIKTFRDFEFQMAKVKAVSGATERDFFKLSTTAKELGRTTFFTATQVGSLQENYAKLGFTTEEILNAQEATIQLATATGSDLARAAIVAGSAVRGFGLDATETQRVVDVMAVAFTSSALDIEKWQTSMTKVAPIAKSAGFSIEDTAAIMAKLADSGIEASIAGTSLRNILLKMQSPTSDLTKSFGKTIHSFDELLPAMKKFTEEGGSMADIMEVVDLRQAAAFEQMLTSADNALILRDALLQANGAAKEMSEIIGDTLEGDFRELTSAWEGFQIGIIEGSGRITTSIRKIVDVTTALLNKLTDYNKTNKEFAQGLVADQMSIVKASLTDQIELFKTLSKADQEIYGKTKAEFIKQRITFLEKERLETARIVNLKNVLNQENEDEKDKYDQIGHALVELNKLYNEELNVVEKIIPLKKKKKKDDDLEIEKTKKKIQLSRTKLDLDKEINAFQLGLMMEGSLNEIEMANLKSRLIKEEIDDLKKLLSQLVYTDEQRKIMMTNLFELEKKLGDQSSKDKDKRLEEDIVRAALSGQNAMESVKSVIRAHIMEAVAIQIKNIMATVPFPLNLIVGAGAGLLVAGLVDKGMAMIPDKFANGGMVNGKSHANGGEKFAVGGRVVELEGGEAVINKRSTSMFRSQLSAMNSAGGGVKFADGGLLNMPSFSQQQFNALGQNQMMGAMGGQSKVVVVEADITSSQNAVSVIQSDATI